MSAGEARRPDRWPDADHSDLVVQLRRHALGRDARDALLQRAADEIERLRLQSEPSKDPSR